MRHLMDAPLVATVLVSGLFTFSIFERWQPVQVGTGLASLILIGSLVLRAIIMSLMRTLYLP